MSGRNHTLDNWSCHHLIGHHGLNMLKAVFKRRENHVKWNVTLGAKMPISYLPKWSCNRRLFQSKAKYHSTWVKVSINKDLDRKDNPCFSKYNFIDLGEYQHNFHNKWLHLFFFTKINAGFFLSTLMVIYSRLLC